MKLNIKEFNIRVRHMVYVHGKLFLWLPLTNKIRQKKKKEKTINGRRKKERKYMYVRHLVKRK